MTTLPRRPRRVPGRGRAARTCIARRRPRAERRRRRRASPPASGSTRIASAGDGSGASGASTSHTAAARRAPTSHPAIAGTLRLPLRPGSPSLAAGPSPAPAALTTARHAPLVSCLMPTGIAANSCFSRSGYFQRQGEPSRELIILDDGDGTRRRTCRVTTRSIRTGPPGSASARSVTSAASWPAAGLSRSGTTTTGTAPGGSRRRSRRSWPGWPDYRTHDAGVLRGGRVEVLALQLRAARADVRRRRARRHARVPPQPLRARIRYPDCSLAEDAAFLRAAVRGGARLRRVAGDEHFVYLRHAASSWRFACGTFIDRAGGTPPRRLSGRPRTTRSTPRSMAAALAATRDATQHPAERPRFGEDRIVPVASAACWEDAKVATRRPRWPLSRANASSLGPVRRRANVRGALGHHSSWSPVCFAAPRASSVGRRRPLAGSASGATAGYPPRYRGAPLPLRQVLERHSRTIAGRDDAIPSAPTHLLQAVQRGPRERGCGPRSTQHATWLEDWAASACARASTRVAHRPAVVGYFRLDGDLDATRLPPLVPPRSLTGGMARRDREPPTLVAPLRDRGLRELGRSARQCRVDRRHTTRRQVWLRRNDRSQVALPRLGRDRGCDARRVGW